MNSADLVGIDIGGTKTRIRIRFASGATDDFTTMTADWRPIEQQPDPAALLRLITDRADLTESTVVAVGAHGCDTRAQCAEFAAGLSRCSRAAFVVLNDAELLVPAAGLTRGIGMIIGTGSIVVGEGADGSLLTAGGWGWLLGDPGSAPALVREAAKAVLAATDRGDPLDPLGKSLCQEYGVGTALELAYRLTAARTVTEWAHAAPVVFESARQGSELASRVLQLQAEQLASEVLSLRGRGAQGDQVVIGGGVAAGQPEFVDTIGRHLADRAGLSAMPLTGAPIDGAMTVAQRFRDEHRQDTFTRHHLDGGSIDKEESAP